MSDVTQLDCVLDLVQALEMVDPGFLFGSETTTITSIDTEAYADRRSDFIVLTLSDGSRVELRVELKS